MAGLLCSNWLHIAYVICRSLYLFVELKCNLSSSLFDLQIPLKNRWRVYKCNNYGLRHFGFVYLDSSKALDAKSHKHTYTHWLTQGYLMNVRVQLQIARCLCEINYLYYCAVVNKDIRAHNQKQIKQIDRDSRRKRQREGVGNEEGRTLDAAVAL